MAYNIRGTLSLSSASW